MQILSISLFLVFSAASVHATCFTGGASGVAANLEPLLNPICAGLMGFYLKKEQRHQCVTDSAGQQWDFTLQYIGSGDTRTIGNLECQGGFKKETQCSHGGSTSYANWKYTADPNAGSCYGVDLGP